MNHILKPIKIGQFNYLRIEKIDDEGILFEQNILMPKRHIPRDETFEVNRKIDVFVYSDGRDKLLASFDKPYTQVNQFACLEVIEISDAGIFLDWGLPKDLMLPFSEEVGRVEVDDYVIVYTYLDERSKRLIATMKYESYLTQKPHQYKTGDKVRLLIENKTPLGIKTIVDHAHWGLIYKSDMIGDIETGDEVYGYIKAVRPDGKLDIQLQPTIQSPIERNQLEDRILEKLERNNGTLMLCDKSSADQIYAVFGISKSAFKKAIGGLFKKKKIKILDDRIISANNV